MSKSAMRIPAIHSEITVALAYAGWSPKQLLDYACLYGFPITEAFLADAMGERWFAFRKKADPVQADNLIRVLASIGIALEERVFGIVPLTYAGMAPASGSTTSVAVMALVSNYPRAQLRLAIQDPGRGKHQTGRSVALLINTGSQYLFCELPTTEASALIAELYAACLTRLEVCEHRLPAMDELSFSDAACAMLQYHYRTARFLSRSRLLDVLLEA